MKYNVIFQNSPGFTIIELLISITLSMLVVMAGLSYYQWSIHILKKQQQTVSEELALRNMVHWLEEDLKEAGWMGCRFWGEPVLLETDDPKVATISEKVGLKAVWHGVSSNYLLTPYLISTTYRVVPGSPVVWIQKTMPYVTGHPVVPERCDRLSIMKNLQYPHKKRSFSSVLWFFAEHQDGHQGIYRKDLFGQTEEVLRDVFRMSLEWSSSDTDQERAILKIQFSEESPIRAFKVGQGSIATRTGGVISVK